MLRPKDWWFENQAVESPAEPPGAPPGTGQDSTLAPDDDLGLRTLLEHPDQFAHAWWRDQASRSRTKPARSTRPRAA